MRLKERNDDLLSHVRTFKMERSRMYDIRAEKISLDLIKTEEKLVSFNINNVFKKRKINEDNEKDRRHRREEHQFDVEIKVKEIRRANKEA